MRQGLGGKQRKAAQSLIRSSCYLEQFYRQLAKHPGHHTVMIAELILAIERSQATTLPNPWQANNQNYHYCLGNEKLKINRKQIRCFIIRLYDRFSVCDSKTQFLNVANSKNSIRPRCRTR